MRSTAAAPPGKLWFPVDPVPRPIFSRPWPQPEVALFVLALGAYAYFFQAGGWNQNSRFDTVRAVVEQHSLIIDDYVGNTGDFSVVNHQFYGDKAPGLQLLAIPVYAAVHSFFPEDRRPRGRLVHLGAYLSTLVSVGLPSALAVVVLFSTARRLGASAGAAAFLATAHAFGTLAFPYATLFYSHQLTAALLLFAFALLVRARAEARWTRGGLSAAGFLLGYAIATEYPAALAAGVIGLYALATARPRGRIVWMALGGVIPLLALAAYHTFVFGGPFTIGYHSSPDGAREGGMILGITLPSLRVLGKVLFAESRGLLRHVPWLVLALPGAVLLALSRARRAEGLALLGLVVAGLWFNSSLTSTLADWKGGTGVGTRHLVPYLPFYVLSIAGLAAVVRARIDRPRARRAVLAAFAGAVLLSTARMTLATAVRPEAPDVDDPFADHLLPLWREGRVATNPLAMHNGPTYDEPQAWNLGQKMGLSGRRSLLPLGLFAAAAGVWLVTTLRGTRFNRVDPISCVANDQKDRIGL
jgi:hypothetical protein